jgi:transmembrane sensor
LHCSRETAVYATTAKSDLILAAPDDTSLKLDPLLREAFAWVIQLHSGEATVEDAEALEQWRRTSSDHEAAFRDAVRLWRTLGDETRRLVAEGGRLETSKPAAVRTIALSRRSLIGGAMAASIAAGYAIVRPPLGLWPSLEELMADYRTAKGEQRTIALSDNISLKLNTETSIAVRSNQNEAHIEIISGEAAITSARDGVRQVVVDAASGRITALHANFEVRCLDGKVTVSCIDGAVEVGVGSRSMQITKEQQISYTAADNLSVPVAIDPIQTTAWQSGLLIVHDWPMSKVVDEINRYRAGKIVIMNSALGRRQVTGTFHLDHLDDFIGQAHSLFDATVRYLPGGVILLT